MSSTTFAATGTIEELEVVGSQYSRPRATVITVQIGLKKVKLFRPSVPNLSVGAGIQLTTSDFKPNCESSINAIYAELLKNGKIELSLDKAKYTPFSNTAPVKALYLATIFELMEACGEFRAPTIQSIRRTAKRPSFVFKINTDEVTPHSLLNLGLLIGQYFSLFENEANIQRGLDTLKHAKEGRAVASESRKKSGRKTKRFVQEEASKIIGNTSISTINISKLAKTIFSSDQAPRKDINNPNSPKVTVSRIRNLLSELKKEGKLTISSR